MGVAFESPPKGLIMSDDNVIPFPNKRVEEAQERADFFYVMSVYFVQNFKDLFKNNVNDIPMFIAFLTLTEIMENHIADGEAYIQDDDNGHIQLAMMEGLHEHLVKEMKELAAEHDERKDHDIH